MKVRRLYTLYCLALPWRFKIGIAYNVEDRTAQIQGELSREIGRPVYVRQALAVPLLFPERTERWMHSKFAVLSPRCRITVGTPNGLQFAITPLPLSGCFGSGIAAGL
jgi:hypothetical protein